MVCGNPTQLPPKILTVIGGTFDGTQRCFRPSGRCSDLDGFCQIVSIVKAQASVQAASAKMQNGSPWLAIFVFTHPYSDLRNPKATRTKCAMLSNFRRSASISNSAHALMVHFGSGVFPKRNIRILVSGSRKFPGTVLI